MRSPFLLYGLIFSIILTSCSVSKRVAKIQESNEENCEHSGQKEILASGYKERLDQYVVDLSKSKLNHNNNHYTLIYNTHVVDVAEGRVLKKKRSVAIDHNKIVAINKRAKHPFGKNACVQLIDGSNQYLAPGLCDMHVHNYECTHPDYRLGYLLNGITTIRQLGIDTWNVEEQTYLAERKIIGPNLYMANGEWQHLDDNEPILEDSTLNLSFDWWYYHSHYFAHNDFKEWVGLREPKVALSIDQWYNLPRMRYPAHTVFEQWTDLDYILEQDSFPTFWFIAKFYHQHNVLEKHYMPDTLRANKQEEYLLMQKVVQEHSDRFCIGTEIGISPMDKIGDSYRAELFWLDSLVGLPNETILQIATMNAGNMVDELKRFDADEIAKNDSLYYYYDLPFGRVEEGYRADLLLLNQNPLADIDNYKKIRSLMVNGVWLSEKELAELRSVLP